MTTTYETDYDEVRNALSYLDPNDRETWWKVGAALKSEFDEGGRSLWEDWSRSYPKWNERESNAQWKSFKYGHIHIGTLFHMAKANGFTFSQSYRAPSAEEIAHREAIWAVKREVQAAWDSAAKQHAQRTANTVWNSRNTRPADAAFPYLQNKGIADPAVLSHVRINTYNGKEQLVIPMYDRPNHIINRQAIDTQGGKFFLPGGEVAGAYGKIAAPNADWTGGVYLAEGFATAASIHKATGKPVVIAFNAGNLPKVAAKMAAMLPDNTPIYIAADNDASQTGIKKAAEAAQILGERAKVVMPEFNEGDIERFKETHGQDSLPSDFNDLHGLNGLEAVKAALDTPLSPDRLPETAAVPDISGNAEPEIPNRQSAHLDPAELHRIRETELAKIQNGKIRTAVRQELAWRDGLGQPETTNPQYQTQQENNMAQQSITPEQIQKHAQTIANIGDADYRDAALNEFAEQRGISIRSHVSQILDARQAELAGQYARNNPYAPHAAYDTEARRNADDWEARKPLTETMLSEFNTKAERQGFVTYIDSRHADGGVFQADKSVGDGAYRVEIEGKFKNHGGQSVYEDARDFTVSFHENGEITDYLYTNDLDAALAQSNRWLQAHEMPENNPSMEQQLKTELENVALPENMYFETETLPNGRAIARIQIQGYDNEVMLDKLEQGGYIATFNDFHLEFNQLSALREMTSRLEREYREYREYMENQAMRETAENRSQTAAEQAAVSVSATDKTTPAEKHYSEQIIDQLTEQHGWKKQDALTAQKTFQGIREGGMLNPDGNHVMYARFNETGRYLALESGWDTVFDIDARDIAPPAAAEVFDRYAGQYAHQNTVPSWDEMFRELHDSSNLYWERQETEQILPQQPDSLNATAEQAAVPVSENPEPLAVVEHTIGQDAGMQPETLVEPALDEENGIEFDGEAQDLKQEAPETELAFRQPENPAPERETITAEEVRQNLARARAAEALQRQDGQRQPEIVPQRQETRPPAAPEADLGSLFDEAAPSENPAVSQKPKPILDLNYATATGLEARYVRVGGEYMDLHDRKTVVFKDKGSVLKTGKSDAQTVSDMLDTAQAKNWGVIKISGSREFKQQMWLESQLRGIPSKGYKPDAYDIAKRDQLLEERQRNSIEQIQPQQSRQPENSSVQSSSAEPHSQDRKVQAAESQKGVMLLEHGAAPYLHNPDNRTNYFVKYEQDGEIRERWGVELESALTESGAQAGDRIEIHDLGRQPVVVNILVRDESGKIVRDEQGNKVFEKKEVEKNLFRIEVLERQQDRRPEQLPVQEKPVFGKPDGSEVSQNTAAASDNGTQQLAEAGRLQTQADMPDEVRQAAQFKNEAVRNTQEMQAAAAPQPAAAVNPGLDSARALFQEKYAKLGDDAKARLAWNWQKVHEPYLKSLKAAGQDKWHDAALKAYYENTAKLMHGKSVKLEAVFTDASPAQLKNYEQTVLQQQRQQTQTQQQNEQVQKKGRKM